MGRQSRFFSHGYNTSRWCFLAKLANVMMVLKSTTPPNQFPPPPPTPPSHPHSNRPWHAHQRLPAPRHVHHAQHASRRVASISLWLAFFWGWSFSRLRGFPSGLPKKKHQKEVYQVKKRRATHVIWKLAWESTNQESPVFVGDNIIFSYPFGV